MYGRNYQGRELNFEASGGLLHSALVMQDQETDTYWSIMTGTALAGEMRGLPLEELPLGEKVQWKDWKRRYPDTLVLSVDGQEHIQNNPYDNYFSSDAGFRDRKAADTRLATKAPIYAFQLDGRQVAVPFEAFEGGAVFEYRGRKLFLYRPAGVDIYYSTVAFQSRGAGFEKKGGRWVERGTGAVFDAEEKRFVPPEKAESEVLPGFDTFWYTWSLTNPGTELLTG